MNPSYRASERDEKGAYTSFLRASGEFRFWVELAEVKRHLEDTGSWAPVELENLSPGEKRDVLRIVAAYCVDLVVDTWKIRVERDPINALEEKKIALLFTSETPLALEQVYLI